MLNMYKALLQLNCRQYHSEKYHGNEIIFLRPSNSATKIRKKHLFTDFILKGEMFLFHSSGAQPTTYLMGPRESSPKGKATRA
jgi:hypothetical protein